MHIIAILQKQVLLEFLKAKFYSMQCCYLVTSKSLVVDLIVATGCDSVLGRPTLTSLTNQIRQALGHPLLELVGLHGLERLG